VSAPVAGQLNRVPLRAGAPITEGETVLATLLPEPAGFLDPRTRAQAEAALLAAESTVELRQAEWERAQAMFALAEKEFTRAEALQKNRAIATQERDAAESLLQVRSREMRAAEFALRVAGFEVEQAQAALLQT